MRVHYSPVRESGEQLSELFLSIDDFWQRAEELGSALRKLDAQVSPLATQAYYSADEDRALIAVVLDTRSEGPDSFAELSQLLFRLRIDCFEIAALSAPERDHFQGTELPRYRVRVRAAQNVSTAVLELFQRAGGDGSSWAEGTPAETKHSTVGQYSQIRRKPRAAIGTPSVALDANPSEVTPDFLLKQVRDVAADVSSPPPWPKEPSNFEGPVRPEHIADGSRPRPETRESPIERETLRVRFLRGERWLPGRARYISNREIRIATGAPLRLGDSAIIGISFETEELFVSGTVSAVEPIDSEPVSSPGFDVAFAKLAAPKSAQLVEMLRRARDAGISLSPPPVRGAPRFPVSWPVVVRTPAGAQRAVASDISWSGVYLDIDSAVGSDVLFAIPLDNAGDSIRCRGSVVRTVASEQAEMFQSVAGCGISITHFGSGDSERYRAFLERVKNRCQRRVVVAAAPLRAKRLTDALAAAGYAVTSSTDPSALAELADREARPPDIAVIDDSLASAMEGEMLRALFRKRNVPCLSSADEKSDQTRQQVDRILAVEKR